MSENNTKIEKLKMQTENTTKDNQALLIDFLKAHFPNCIEETIAGDKVGIDLKQLEQDLSSEAIIDGTERYEMTWPGKRRAKQMSAISTTDTLRPCREESENFDTTENLYIEGDNLQVLRLLRENYLGAIKMIYIDPPYNTGHDFIYTDKFSQVTDDYKVNSGQVDENNNPMVANPESEGRFHTNWLNMMYPRLKLAKDLLRDDGVIFISIDDNEQANLKKVCDEVFGECNFIGVLSVENNPKGRKNSSFISVSSEYCVIYARNKVNANFIENVPKKASDMTLDSDGKYVHNSGKRVLVGENDFNNYVRKIDSDKNYVVYYNEQLRNIVLKKENINDINSELINKGYKRYYSHNKGMLVENTYTESKFKSLFEDKALEFANDKIYEKNFSDTIRIKSQLVNKKYEAIVHGQKMEYSMELTTTGAGSYLKDLFKIDVVPFSAPKNVGLLKLLISLFPKDPLIVLDFFSGSSTTADAVMQLNSIDNGNRKYIMVQYPEEIKEKDDAYKLGYKNICEIGKERIRRAGKKIMEEHPEAKIDTGFRVLKLDNSNMKDVFYTPDMTNRDLFDVENIKEDRTEEDLLFQVMIELGVELSAKIVTKEVYGKKVYDVGDGAMVACFDKDLNESTIKEIAQGQPMYFVSRDGAMGSDDMMENLVQIFKKYSTETLLRIL